MNKYYFIIIYLALITSCSFSQLVLTSAIDPTPGDIEFRVSADTNGISEGNSGANQTWNYPNLIKTDSVSVHWLLPSQTPYASLFPASNLACLDTCYNYFDSSATKLELVGYFSHGTAVNYTNFETMLTYPFTFNSNFTDNFAAGYAQTGDSLIVNGTANVTADGYGLLNLPFGVFLNALRLKEIITVSDSSVLYHMAIVTHYTVYDWYVPYRKFSVFKIVYTSVVIPGFGTINAKHVFYNPATPVIGIRPISSEVVTNYSLGQNYPNPFNPSTKINLQIVKNGLVKLSVYDILGREVRQLVNQNLQSGAYQVDFDASDLPSGIYFYVLSAADYTETKKMILLK